MISLRSIGKDEQACSAIFLFIDGASERRTCKSADMNNGAAFGIQDGTP
jgi:hypothetical protein